MHKLPIPVPPIKHESMLGYLIRLAARHSRKTYGELLRDCGWKRSLPRDSETPELTDFVAGITGLQYEVISSNCRADVYLGLGRVSDRVYKNLYLASPRICLTCVSEDHVHRSDWQFAPISYCAKHEMLLSQACPACGKAFKWDNRLLGERCYECFKSWETLSLLLKVDEPAYFASFKRLSSAEQKLDWIHDVLLAVQRVLRPMDTLFDTWERPPKEVTNWHELVDSAYSLLSDHTRFSKWADSCVSWRSGWSILGKTAQFGPLTTLQSMLRLDWPFSGLDIGAIEGSEPLSENGVTPSGPHAQLVALPSRIKCSSLNNTDRDLCSQVDMHQLSRVLGCDSRDLADIVESSPCALAPLAPMNSARAMRDALFSLEMVTELLESQAGTTGGNYVQLDELRHWLPLHATGSAEVYAALFAGKIRFFIDDGVSPAFRRIRVSPFSLMRYLRRNLFSKRSEPITLPKAAGVLGIPESQIPELVKAGLLVALPWQHKTVAFSCDQLHEILTCYSISSRWFRLRNLPYLSACKQLAKTSPKPPTVGRFLYSKDSYVPFLIREVINAN